MNNLTVTSRSFIYRAATAAIFAMVTMGAWRKTPPQPPTGMARSHTAPRFAMPRSIRRRS